MVHPRQLGWALIGIAALTATPVSAHDSVELVPEDACIVELNLPEGSTVKLNGQDQKTARQFTYNALTAKKLHSIPLEILYPSSKVSKHLLLLKAGHRIRLAAVDPEAEVPELVLQTTLSHTPGGDISPDGTMIALGSSTGVTTIYDVSTGRLLRTIPGFREDCTPQFVAGGKNLLVSYFDTYLPLFSFGGGDGVSLSVKVLYSTETGEILAEFDDPSISTAISPLGNIFAFSKDFKSGTGKWAPKQTPYVLVVDSDTGKVIHKCGPYEVASNLHLSFSSDGKQLGVGDSHDIDIYDTDSWRKTRVYHYGGSNNESIDTCFLSPEGTHLHVVTQKYNPDNQGPDYTTRMIDVSSRRQLWSRSGRQSSGHIGRIFSPDNKHAILGNTVVDVISGRQVYKSSGNGQRFLPSGELLVVYLPTESQLEPCFSGSKANSVGLQLESDNSLDFEFLELLGILGNAFSRCDIVDIKTGTHKESHGKIQTISRDATMALVVDMPSLSLTASASEIVEYVKTVHKGLMPMLLINLQTEKPVWRLSTSSFSASQTHLLPGGKVIAYSSLQEVLLRGVALKQTPKRCSGSFCGHSEDGSLVMTQSDSFVYVWRTETGEQIGRFMGKEPTLSPCRQYILTDVGDGDEQSTILWNVSSGSRIVQLDGFRTFLLGGAMLYASIDNDHCFYQCDTGKQTLKIERGPGGGNDPAISPNGQFLSYFHYVPGPKEATGKWYYYLVNAKDNKRYDLESDGICFSHDSKWLCTSNGIVDTSTGRRILKFENTCSAYGTPPTWHPDHALVLAKQDDDLRMYNAETAKPEVGFKPIDFSIYGNSSSRFTFSPNGYFIIAVSDEGYESGSRPDYGSNKEKTSQIISSKLWDARTGKLLCNLGDIKDYAFSNDGQWLYTVDGPMGQVHLWDLAVGKEIGSITRMNQMKDWLVTTPEGLFDGPSDAMERICYRIGGGLNVVPVERFFQNFYRPSLLAAIMRGERPLPRVQMGKELPPSVKIILPTTGGETEEDFITIEAAIEGKGGGIKTPWIMQNGTRVAVDSEPVREGNMLRWKFELPLIDGENKIEVQSASADGSWESEPATITFIRSEPTEGTELYLLAIGVSEYADESANLQYAAADAEAFGDLFRTRGAGCYGEGRVHVETLLDKEATSQNIEKAIEKIAEQAGPQDVFMLTLSGHGIMVGQRYFFLPHEFTSEDEGGWQEDAKKHGLPGDVLQTWINKVPALKRVVVYDTCQSGGAVAVAGLSRNPFEFQRAFETFRRSTGCHVIAAATASQNAEEIDDLGHGALTYALLAGLGAVDRGPFKNRTAESKDGLVQVRDWLGFAAENVPSLTKTYYGREQLVDVFGEGRSFPILRVDTDTP